MINDGLLKILACPACHESVRVEGEKIVCTGCGRRYPIRDGIPIMLLDEAELPREGPSGAAGASTDPDTETKVS